MATDLEIDPDLVEVFGALEWDPDYDYKAERSRS